MAETVSLETTLRMFWRDERLALRYTPDKGGSIPGPYIALHPFNYLSFLSTVFMLLKIRMFSLTSKDGPWPGVRDAAPAGRGDDLGAGHLHRPGGQPPPASLPHTRRLPQGLQRRPHQVGPQYFGLIYL